MSWRSQHAVTGQQAAGGARAGPPRLAARLRGLAGTLGAQRRPPCLPSHARVGPGVLSRGPRSASASARSTHSGSAHPFRGTCPLSMASAANLLHLCR